ncbi:MAG: hypothetical protein U1F71_11705 [Verrucomicrobiaceae bacterium]
MKTRLCTSLLALLGLSSCVEPAAQDGSGYFYASSNKPTPASSSSSTARSTSTPVPRGGYAPGSGPTAMPGGNQFMYQQNVTGPFGSSSSSTVIQSSGGVQSYQTIGGVPVYPGTPVPGYVPNQPYYGAPVSQQPVYVPGVGGSPGYYINPTTGARMQP